MNFIAGAAMANEEDYLPTNDGSVYSRAGHIVVDRYLPRVLDKIETFIHDKKSASTAKEAVKNYQRQSLERCSYIKTVINKGEKIDLLDIYVPLNFSCGSNKYNQTEFINEVSKRKFITLSGTGGCGKSTAMRFLWISLLVRSSDKIPVFIELRSFNDISSINIEILIADIMFYGMPHTDAISVFRNMLKAGSFIFIFDGFDEVLDSKKNEVERQINDISIKYDKNIIVVSTRPNERVLNWQTFDNFDVMPLNKSQVLLLIEKIAYSDIDVKINFKKAVDSRLFNSHKSFLSIPLLVNMMLMTFSDLAEFPNQMHVFYEQAFWALFKTHDARKAWLREQSSGLDMAQFERLLSALSFLTHKLQKSRFTQDEIFYYIKQATDIAGINVDARMYLSDLVNNVCIMMQDGLYFVFIHRSFQEYFAARFVSSIPEDGWFSAASSLPLDDGEAAVKLLHDMNSSRFTRAVLMRAIADGYFESHSGTEWIKKISSEKSIKCMAVCGSNSRITSLYLQLSDNASAAIMDYFLTNCAGDRGRSKTMILGLHMIPKSAPLTCAVSEYAISLVKKYSTELEEMHSDQVINTSVVELFSCRGSRIQWKVNGKQKRPSSTQTYAWLSEVGMTSLIEDFVHRCRKAASGVRKKVEMQDAMLKKAVAVSRYTKPK